MTCVFHAPFPIRRPYTPVFISLRERCSALIEEMDRATSLRGPPSDPYLSSGAWDAYSPGLIIARIDWEHAELVLSWGVDDDTPVRAKRSPDHRVDVSELKQAALACDQPRSFFESHALYILYVCQSFLTEFFRDGPTDDIPFDRHLIFAQGMDGETSTIWIGDVTFGWDDQQR